MSLSSRAFPLVLSCRVLPLATTCLRRAPVLLTPRLRNQFQSRHWFSTSSKPEDVSSFFEKMQAKREAEAAKRRALYESDVKPPPAKTVIEVDDEYDVDEESHDAKDGKLIESLKPSQNVFVDTQAFKSILRQVVRAKDATYGQLFPEYMHDQLTILLTKKFADLFVQHPDLKVSTHQTCLLLQVLTAETAPECVNNPDDICTILCPTAPRLGEQMVLPDFPQKGTVLERTLNLPTQAGEPCTMTIEFGFEAGATASFDFTVEQDKPDLQVMIAQIKNGTIPREYQGEEERQEGITRFDVDVPPDAELVEKGDGRQ